MKTVSVEEYERVVSELEELKRKVDAMLPVASPPKVASYDSEPDGLEEV